MHVLQELEPSIGAFDSILSSQVCHFPPSYIDQDTLVLDEFLLVHADIFWVALAVLRLSL
jgi:hypothetical protein